MKPKASIRNLKLTDELHIIKLQLHTMQGHWSLCRMSSIINKEETLSRLTGGENSQVKHAMNSSEQLTEENLRDIFVRFF